MRNITIPAAWSSLVRQDDHLMYAGGDYVVCFDALYQQYYAPVLAFLHFLVGTHEAAEDLTSLVFEKVWAHRAGIRTQETVGPWLFRIARNCATDYFRRYKPTISLDLLVQAPHPQANSPEDAAIARDEERILLAHLSQLSEREREVIGLKFVVSLSNREIARVLQIPEGTVSSLLYRALRRLRVALEQEGGHHESS